MPRISFLLPAALLLLSFVPLMWLVAFLAPRRVGRWRFWSGLTLRSLIVTALALALAGTQLSLPSRTLTTIFLLDRSDSVSAAQREQAEAYIADALQAQRTGDRTGVVVFGQNALVERAPAQLAALGRLSSTPVGVRTNLQDAIQLGLALFPDDTQKRLVLLSDGGENTGRAAEALQLAQVRGVPVDVVGLPAGQGPDVLVERVTAPATAREGQDIALDVAVQSGFATRGQLQVFVDGQLALEQAQDVPAGESSVALRVPAGEAGFRRIEVRLEAEGDSASQNNRAAALVEIEGPPRILIIAAEPRRATNLQQAITASGARPEVRAPNQAPGDLAELEAYAGVVLFDTPARSLPRPLVEALPTYVRDLGGGLAMIGGGSSFGAGGYRRTPIEPILPVLLDPLNKREQPDVALVMVIDRSGSMSDSSGGNGRTKLDLAKESVYQASLGLSDQDQIGLVVFDENAEWVLPLQRLPSAIDIEQALSQFGPGGGTNIRPGVEQAAQAMSSAEARVKHVILLTDGIADSNYADLISQMQQQDITISTVAIGDDANPNLEAIAQEGGGRFYQVRQVDDVPNIFLQETVIIAGRDIVETEFTPAIALPSPIVRGVEGLPRLLGYNGTEQKPTARTILVSPDEKPILAQEQIGLGRTVAWTSDFDGRWSTDWVRWNEFPRFVGGLIDLLLPPRRTEGIALSARTQGDQAVLELEAQDTQGQPLNNLVVEGRLVDPEQQGESLAFTQVGPGRYRATAPTDQTGVYLAQAAVRGSDGEPLGTVSAGVAVSYSPEYGERREDLPLLSDIARVTSGRVNPTPAQVYEPLDQPVGTVRELGLPLLLMALLLLPFDIAVRRLFLPLGSLLPRRTPRSIPTATPAPVEVTITRLSAAKRRARPEQSTLQAAPQPPPEPTATSPRPQAKTERQSAPQRSTTLDDDQFARLLAAKKRARGERKDP